MSENPDKFAALYTQHAGHVLRMARHFGVPVDRADDIAQEVWLSVFRQLPGLDLTHTLRPWLTAVVWNTVRRARRGVARAIRKDQALQQLEAAAPTNTGAPEARLDAAWTAERLLQELPEEQRLVLLLCDGEGMTEPEVAESLGVKVNTISSRRRLARRRCLQYAGALNLAALLVLLDQHCRALQMAPTPFATLSVSVSEAAARPPVPAPASGWRGTSASLTILAATAAALVVLGIVASRSGLVERVKPLPEISKLGEAMQGADAAELLPVFALLLREPPPPPPPPPPPIKAEALDLRPPISRTRTRHRLPSSLAAENRLIEAAQAALDSHRPQLALRYTAELREGFRSGPTAETRELISIRAYCARGQVERARAVAAARPGVPRFVALARHPCPNNVTAPKTADPESTNAHAITD